MPKAEAKLDPLIARCLKPEEIDALAFQYTLNEERIQKLSDEQKNIRAALVSHTEAHGSESTQGLKTKIARGDQFIVRVTRCERTIVDSAKAGELEQKCPAHIFETLFDRVTKFCVAANALQFLSKPTPKDAPRDLRRLFASAVRTEEQTPRLSVTKKHWTQGVGACRSAKNRPAADRLQATRVFPRN